MELCVGKAAERWALGGDKPKAAQLDLQNAGGIARQTRSSDMITQGFDSDHAA